MDLVVDWSSHHLRSLFMPQRLSSFKRGSRHACICNEVPH